MSWITIVWSMNAAACLTLAGIYLLVWCKQRQDWAHLLFSFTAVAAAAIAAFELAMMHAETVGQCEALVRWIHVPVWVLVISFVSFVRLYLHAGRRWLAWSICCLRTLVLILNFVFTPNLNFRHITSLRQFSWGGGEIISVPVGVANPWGLLSSVSLLLLLIFFVDATITVWRRGDRRRALVVGGSMIFGAILAWHVPLVIWGIIDIPLFLCFAYSGIVAAMAYELSYDLLHAAQLSRQLQASEADLRETEQRMELAASAAKLGMWMWDIPRNEIWLTDKGRTLFGFGASEKLDFDRFQSVLHPEDRQSVLQAVENTLHTGAEYEAEYRVVLPDGQLRWISGRGQVEFNGDGQPARVRGASVDITKRKQAEEQAARQRNEMAHLSRVSTLGELSGSIAHELSLPLSAILSNAQAAQRILANGQVDHTELREILNEVVSEDKRACEVIRRLRLWLKKGEVQQHSLRINNVVQDVLKLLRSDLIDQKVTVDCELARNLPAVIGDPVQLQQVLVNLVVNACDAMTDCNTAERRLLIRTGTENGSGAVVVSVTDRGGSIPAEKMKQIFEPFFSTKAKGMGLGLSVCHSIIAAHRGQLWTTNNADCGATFHFSLPTGIPGTAVPIRSNGQLDDHA
ncbi:MAG TPA: ATP-binding protein [Candidatus Dormibacteraeota bacterium]|nr:ATP-binding protein [Candidatus Dormibacteraeota bacterium]